MVKKEVEISKKTILVLLVLTVLISVFGTVTLLNAIELGTGPVPQPTPGTQQGGDIASSGVRVIIAEPVVGMGQVSISIAQVEGSI